MQDAVAQITEKTGAESLYTGICTLDIHTPVDPLFALTLSSFQFVEIPTGALQPPPYKYDEKSKHSIRKVKP